jgi:NAD(P)-dependent dehydrogenase (short-subunit alcohol dehydrogenase family)
MTSVTELAGRVAVVTGAGSGLGAAIAHECARAGMAVAALDIDEARAQMTAAGVGELGVPAATVRVDVGDPVSIGDAARLVDEQFGGCDLLCANVGVQQFGSIDRLTDDDWTWVLGVNVLGTVRTVAAFLPLMRRRAGWRQIAITASSCVFQPGVRLGAYTTSKFAVTGYGETLRLELASEGIGVTLVFPAGMSTRHLESSALARPETLGASITMPDDIEAMLSSSSASGEVVIASPEEAVRELLPQLAANEPYVITHGNFRADYELRRAVIDRAFDRMERASGEPLDS